MLQGKPKQHETDDQTRERPERQAEDAFDAERMVGGRLLPGGRETTQWTRHLFGNDRHQ